MKEDTGRFDGQGDVVGLEDPGTMQAAYDFCPTGNEADLASTILTSVALGNPLRMGALPYDDLTKDYFGPLITEDDSGTATQVVAYRNGDAVLSECGNLGDPDYADQECAAPIGPGGAGSPPGPLGRLVPSRQPYDPAAQALADELGGEAQVEFEGLPGREFDVVSDQYVAQAKPAGFQLSQDFRRQARATFEAARATGRTPYFYFAGSPEDAVLPTLLRYSNEYGTGVVIAIGG